MLCPFCDLPLPARPSQELIEQLTKLCNRVDLEIRPSSLNSMALRLPATETAFACKRHQDESDIIPAGEAAGYPKAGDIHWSLVAKYAIGALVLHISH